MRKMFGTNVSLFHKLTEFNNIATIA